ncbi:MAG: tetratricopeptide repeat protein [Dissulfurispiraceae bacterium]|jgi:tetratricopeptide (TPR) repeat protein
MPKAIKKRIFRKTQKDGDLGEAVSDIRKKLRDQQRNLVYALIAFGLIIITVSAFFIYNRVNAGKAADLEYDAYKILAGSYPAQYSSPADRYKDALAKFNASYSAKKSPSVLLYVANCNYALGNLDETIKTLKKVIEQYPDPKISSLAYYKMAMTYIRKGDLNTAINTFDIMANTKDALLQDLALMESGKTLESMGRSEEAKKKYNELIAKFPKSQMVSEAKSRLGT